MLEQARCPLSLIGPVASQLGIGHGVEGAGPHRGGHPQPGQPLAQLTGGLAGEGDDEGVLGRPAAVEGPAGDAAGEHPGLAGSGPGHDAQGGRVRGDGGQPPAGHGVRADEQRSAPGTDDVELGTAATVSSRL